MPLGMCELCLRSGVELRDGHFIPAGFYRLARDEERINPNPVLMNEEVSLASAEQARDYFLCADCEQRFNRNGEDWILRNCWHNETEFPLRLALLVSSPSTLSSPGFTIYCGDSISGVDPDQ